MLPTVRIHALHVAAEHYTLHMNCYAPVLPVSCNTFHFISFIIFHESIIGYKTPLDVELVKVVSTV
jgi:hypothetical protein